jgi:predicted transposase/invertase (TIGR01784 family)
MSSIIVSPHDKVFRASLKNIRVAKEYFKKYLPKEILNAVNLNILEPCPEIYVNKHLKLSESDVIYKTEISGNTGYICLAAEQQTQGEIFMPLRVLEYDIAIWQFHRKQYPHSKKLPLIINIVFYTGKSTYPYSTDFKDLLDAPKELVEAFWAKPFTLVELANIPDEELLQQKWAGLFQYFMKKIRSSDLFEYLEIALPLMKSIDSKNAAEYIEAVVNYALAAGEISNPQKFIELLKSELSNETGEKIMTGAEQLFEDGKQQGTLEGERTLLKRLLEKRFGPLSTTYLEKIENAKSEEIFEWSDKVIDAKNLKEIFNQYH